MRLRYSAPAICFLLAGLGTFSNVSAAPSPPAAQKEGKGTREVVLLPEDCRIRSKGNIRDDGSFSFWDYGTLGDWFVKKSHERVVLFIKGRGKPIHGEAPRLAVEVINIQGQVRRSDQLDVTSSSAASYSCSLSVKEDFFGLRLKHLNRRSKPGGDKLRHLVVKELRVRGASRSSYGPAGYAFLCEPVREAGDRPPERA